MVDAGLALGLGRSSERRRARHRKSRRAPATPAGSTFDARLSCDASAVRWAEVDGHALNWPEIFSTSIAPTAATSFSGNLQHWVPRRRERVAVLLRAVPPVGVSFRMNDTETGLGGAPIVLDDPSGNAVELFQPAR